MVFLHSEIGPIPVILARIWRVENQMNISKVTKHPVQPVFGSWHFKPARGGNGEPRSESATKLLPVHFALTNKTKLSSNPGLIRLINPLRNAIGFNLHKSCYDEFTLSRCISNVTCYFYRRTLAFNLVYSNSLICNYFYFHMYFTVPKLQQPKKCRGIKSSKSNKIWILCTVNSNYTTEKDTFR